MYIWPRVQGNAIGYAAQRDAQHVLVHVYDVGLKEVKGAESSDHCIIIGKTIIGKTLQTRQLRATKSGSRTLNS